MSGYEQTAVQLILIWKMIVSWPATTQPTALKFGVKLVSKCAD
ncbi:hypothetical protein C7378_2444 [Acidipila rosea]|jgi:hypothetical protein|uniref:Uncharacterized protein n=1 Tax=Acidipila rosea TaxID=768535 RepID=A0A4R1L6Y7_9BACT|nr:hypothetical protein C7378_2444 [Acidipila rosea]